MRLVQHYRVLMKQEVIPKRAKDIASENFVLIVIPIVVEIEHIYIYILYINLSSSHTTRENTEHTTYSRRSEKRERESGVE